MQFQLETATRHSNLIVDDPEMEVIHSLNHARVDNNASITLGLHK